jgi:hypothetical protein
MAESATLAVSIQFSVLKVIRIRIHSIAFLSVAVNINKNYYIPQIAISCAS